MLDYQELETVSLNHYVAPADAEQEVKVSLDSPARMVVDVLTRPPLTLKPDLDIDAARSSMRQAQVRAGLVTGEADELLGIVTLADLESRKVLSLAVSSGQSRSDLTIGDLMTARDELKGVPVRAVETACVGELLQTLNNEGQAQMLVVEPESQRICGIVSASNIARRLQMPVSITQRATSFRALVDVISAGRDLM